MMMSSTVTVCQCPATQEYLCSEILMASKFAVLEYYCFPYGLKTIRACRYSFFCVSHRAQAVDSKAEGAGLSPSRNTKETRR